MFDNTTKKSRHMRDHTHLQANRCVLVFSLFERGRVLEKQRDEEECVWVWVCEESSCASKTTPLASGQRETRERKGRRGGEDQGERKKQERDGEKRWKQERERPPLCLHVHDPEDVAAKTATARNAKS